KRRADRGRLSDGRHAARRRSEWIVQERAQSERRAPIPVLLLYARMSATHRRFRRFALDASFGQGESGPHAVPRHQDHEGGRRRRRKNERGDQGALQQIVRGMKSVAGARGRKNLREVRLPRRQLLHASTTLAGAFAAGKLTRPARAQAGAVAAEPITPALIEAAKKEGKLAFYTAMDLAFAQRLAKTFAETFPRIGVRVERSGAERIFTRIGQEYSSNIHAVDVVNTADQAHCLVWKRNGWLAPYMPEEVAKHFELKYYDPDALHITTRILISPIAYN